ncbi:MAG: cobalt-precorrin-5B (C(1))-methyltransferase CbiD [Lachnospiraceae bacterium]|nr:cobalt-precorrin-5B (C(1))-methyltransferase CbiD [Lachnospiraceae bacterium]
MGTGLEKIYVERNNRRMAYGYTTGSCAAAAARGAACLLLSGRAPEEIVLLTPKGIRLRLRPESCRMNGAEAVCCIRKDSGDDPDVTDGVLVWASVRCTEGKDIEIDGGTGVGRVTRPGLEQPVGAAAINRVPRQMIREAVLSVCEEWGYAGGLAVTISIPQGVELAARTFNPRLGIEGGISVLGTSGIVEPMSESALVASIEVELRMRAAAGDRFLVISPGNYGADYIREHLNLDLNRAVKCSNFIGETIDTAVELGVQGILFVSHIGKFVKVAGGIMNTHSRNADCRMEILAAHSLRAGCEAETARAILDCLTTDEALNLMEKVGVLHPAMETMMEAIAQACDRRAYGKLTFGILVFSKERGELGRTKNFEEVLAQCRGGLEESEQA